MQNGSEPSKLIQSLMTRSINVIENRSKLIGLDMGEIHEQHGMTVANLIEAELIGHCHGGKDKKESARAIAGFLKKGYKNKKKHSKKHKKIIRKNIGTYLEVTRIATELQGRMGGRASDYQTHSTMLAIAGLIDHLTSYHILVSFMVDNIEVTREAGSRADVLRKIAEMVPPNTRLNVLIRGNSDWFEPIHANKSFQEIKSEDFGDDDADDEVLKEVVVMPSSKYIQVRILDNNTDVIPLPFRTKVKVFQIPTAEGLSEITPTDVAEMLAADMGLSLDFNFKMNLYFKDDDNDERRLAVSLDSPLLIQLQNANSEHRLGGVYCLDFIVNKE